jgi:SAM-dependent methyltransferase
VQTVDLDRLNLTDGQRALDLGCGRGRHAHALAARGGLQVVGLDRNGEDLAHAAGGLRLFAHPDAQWTVLEGDALALPFADAAFDCVICSEVLEHIVEFEAALEEIARVTRPGGAFALSVPRAWPERICWALSESYRTAPGGHVRIFNARALRQAVVERGFAPTGRHGAHALHSPFWWLKCALGANADSNPLVRGYQAFLEWDILKRPLSTRTLETLLNPVLGKSVVMYFERRAAA